MMLAERERWLLEAACAPGDRAALAWERWSQHADFDRLEPGAYQLLPAVFRNLEPRRPSGTAFRRALAIYRQTWVANLLALREAADRCGELEAKGASYALAGDAALAVMAYPDAGARPIGSVEVLVEDGLETRDWAPNSYQVLAPADLLIRLCQRISVWEPRPRAPVLADAWKLVDRMAAADWARLAALAREEGIILAVRRVLERLARLGAAVPAYVVDELAAARSGLAEWLEYQIRSRPLWPVPGRGFSLRTLRRLRSL